MTSRACDCALGWAAAYLAAEKRLPARAKKTLAKPPCTSRTRTCFARVRNFFLRSHRAARAGPPASRACERTDCGRLMTAVPGSSLPKLSRAIQEWCASRQEAKSAMKGGDDGQGIRFSFRGRHSSMITRLVVTQRQGFRSSAPLQTAPHEPARSSRLRRSQPTPAKTSRRSNLRPGRRSEASRTGRSPTEYPVTSVTER